MFLVGKGGRQGETTSTETVFLKGNSWGETVKPGEGQGQDLAYIVSRCGWTSTVTATGGGLGMS